MKIGFLGGSFDPIHKGHLAIARAARKQFGLTRICFIPAFCSPHKIQRLSQVSAKDRLNMVRLAVNPSKNEKVSNWEIKQKKISYTIHTLRHFAKQFPAAERYLILGLDSYRSFPRWKCPNDIRKISSLLVAPRGSSVKLWNAADQVIRMKSHPVSSTQVREALRSKNQRALARFLPEKVLTYIKKHRLYGMTKQGVGRG